MTPCRLSKPLCIVIWIPLLFCTAIASGTDLPIEAQKQLDFAQQFFDQQQYRRAAEEFERFSFFFPQDPRRPQALLQSGESFLLAGEYGQALSILQTLATRRPLDETAVDANFLLAETHLRMNRVSEALTRLRRVIEAVDEEGVRDRAWFRIGWIELNQYDWLKAREAFAQISETGRETYRIDRLESGLTQTDQIPQKTPGLSGALSIVPGAGQLYNGRYEDALIAFLLNTGLIWAAVDAFDDEQYALGGLLSFIGIGFYSANIYGAISGAHDYNRTRNQEFVNRLEQEMNIGFHPPHDIEQDGKKRLLLSLHFRF